MFAGIEGDGTEMAGADYMVGGKNVDYLYTCGPPTESQTIIVDDPPKGDKLNTDPSLEGCASVNV